VQDEVNQDYSEQNEVGCFAPPTLGELATPGHKIHPKGTTIQSTL